MKCELTEVYCGYGHGKSTLAIGQSIHAAFQGKSVIIVQFLKGKERQDMDFLENIKGLDIKIFRFEKYGKYYEELTEQEKAEEKQNIRNALNFARKVIITRECDFLLLDEILALPELGIVTVNMLAEILNRKDEDMHIVLTGRKMPEELKEHIDSITTLTTEKN